MNSLPLSSQRTLQTQHSDSNIHECPSCGVRSPKNSKTFRSTTDINKQPQVQSPNLYLLRQNSQIEQISPRQKHSLFYSQLFGEGKQPRILTFGSPSKANITFSYLSPPRPRYASTQGRFNTKIYKQNRFPHQREDQPVRQVITDPSIYTNPYQLRQMTAEMTPEKPKILQMKKIKSKQKLQVTLDRRSNSSSQKSIRQSHKNLHVYVNETSRNSPRNSPRHNNLYHSNQLNSSIYSNGSSIYNNSSLQNSSSLYNSRNSMMPPRRIQYKPRLVSPRAINILYNSVPISPQAYIQPIIHRRQQPQINNKDPQSILRQDSKQFHLTIQSDKKSQKNDQLITIQDCAAAGSEQQREMARSIKQQLSLHYDYFLPQQHSGRSISLQGGL